MLKDFSPKHAPVNPLFKTETSRIIFKTLMTLLFVLLTTGIHVYLRRSFGFNASIGVYFFAVFVSANYLGFWFGVLGSFLSVGATVFTIYHVQSAAGALGVTVSTHDYIRISIFLLEGVIISYLTNRTSKWRDLLAVTSRQKKEIEQQERATLAFSSSVSVGIIQADLASGKILFANDAYCGITGYSRDELLNLSFSEITHPDDRQADWEKFTLAVKGELPTYLTQKRYIKKNGEEIWVRVNANVIYDENSIPIRAVAIIQDVTAEKLNQDRLLMEKDKAMVAVITKNQFIANISHEIRTPLCSIMGYSELLLEGKTNSLGNSKPEVERSYLKTILNGSKYLLNIINQLLELSEIEIKAIKLQSRRFDFKKLMEEIENSLLVLASNKELSLFVTYDKKFCSLVYSDPERIRQVLVNLIGNAIKFSDNNSIEIELSSQEVGTQLHYRVLITDHGIGFSKDNRESLFKPFSLSERSADRTLSGNGLGLYISKQLAALLGGDIRLVSSVPNVETIFEFSFKCHLADIASSSQLSVKEERPALGRPEIQTSQNLLRGFRILVAEDSPENSILIQSILQMAGADSVVIAHDGLEVIKHGPHFEFDIVVMDIQMPMMNGFEAMKALRKAQFYKPIMALTAHAFEAERTRCIEAGFDDYLIKPIDRIVLVNRIWSLVNHQKKFEFDFTNQML